MECGRGKAQRSIFQSVNVARNWCWGTMVPTWQFYVHRLWRTIRQGLGYFQGNMRKGHWVGASLIGHVPWFLRTLHPRLPEKSLRLSLASVEVTQMPVVTSSTGKIPVCGACLQLPYWHAKDGRPWDKPCYTCASKPKERIKRPATPNFTNQGQNNIGVPACLMCWIVFLKFLTGLADGTVNIQLCRGSYPT